MKNKINTAFIFDLVATAKRHNKNPKTIAIIDEKLDVPLMFPLEVLIAGEFMGVRIIKRITAGSD